MKISIIVPTYNEEAVIAGLLQYLQQQLTMEAEIIVADGGSTDATKQLATTNGASVLCCRKKGRSCQMNEGAAAATGELLYFLHADTFPPSGFEEMLRSAVSQGFHSGCFRLVFDDAHWFLKLNAWFTRFDINAVRFGDQSLFVQRDIFNKTGGFNENYLLLEDQEIIGRLKKEGRFVVLPAAVTTSARKYRDNGFIRLQTVYCLIYTLYRLGVSQRRLASLYKQLIECP